MYLLLSSVSEEEEEEEAPPPAKVREHELHSDIRQRGVQQY